MEHKQFFLPTQAEIKAQQPVQSDFELKQTNVLKTAKDFFIKEVFGVTNTETFFKKGQRFGRTAIANINYTLSTSDYLVGVTSLVVAPSIGLPLPIRVDGERTIDGASSTTLNTNYQSKTFYTDGANFFTI
jgi:hypothetical protein